MPPKHCQSNAPIPLGGGVFVRGLFAGENIMGGGGGLPPLEILKLQLPHAHPNMQAHAPFRVRKICKLNCH